MDVRALDIDICLYHGNCPDGIGAAFPLWRLFPKIQMIPSYYGNPPPYEKIKNKNIVIVDFSYRKSEMAKICKLASFVILLDHHESNFRELYDFKAPNYICVFNTLISASQISWSYFYGGQAVPWFLNYIGDMDLYKWELPYSREIHAVMEYFQWYTWEKMEEMYSDIRPVTIQINEMLNFARVLSSFREKQINTVSKKAVLCNFMQFRVAVVQGISNLISDIGNYTSTLYDCDFVAVWRYLLSKDEWRISLRTHKNDIDLSKIARKFGGGGHKKASAFIIYGNKALCKNNKALRGSLRDYFKV